MQELLLRIWRGNCSLSYHQLHFFMICSILVFPYCAWSSTPELRCKKRRDEFNGMRMLAELGYASIPQFHMIYSFGSNFMARSYTISEKDGPVIVSFSRYSLQPIPSG